MSTQMICSECNVVFEEPDGYCCEGPCVHEAERAEQPPVCFECSMTPCEHGEPGGVFCAACESAS